MTYYEICQRSISPNRAGSVWEISPGVSLATDRGALLDAWIADASEGRPRGAEHAVVDRGRYWATITYLGDTPGECLALVVSKSAAEAGGRPVWDFSVGMKYFPLAAHLRTLEHALINDLDCGPAPTDLGCWIGHFLDDHHFGDEMLHRLDLVAAKALADCEGGGAGAVTQAYLTHVALEFLEESAGGVSCTDTALDDMLARLTADEDEPADVDRYFPEATDAPGYYPSIGG